MAVDLMDLEQEVAQLQEAVLLLYNCIDGYYVDGVDEELKKIGVNIDELLRGEPWD